MDTATRDRILQAAGRLFGEVGYSRATTRAIAAAAGVNEVTLFRHFSSKQNLLVAFVRQFNAGGFASTFEERLTGSYAADIRLMAEALMAETAANFHMLRLMVCDALELPDLRAVALEGAQGNHARVAAYFRRQIAAGVVRAGLDAETLTQTFEGLFSTALFFSLVFQTSLSPALPPESLLDQMADIFVQGTINRSV